MYLTRGEIAIVAKAGDGKSQFFQIGKHFNVPHASVVLKESVLANNSSPLEPANPFFGNMISLIEEFQ
ncbi:MAG: hypothetical protein F6K10_06075 [Moorea sp. SIO2B7]|nr:hypothetical protein [Moorena sp. SIO2B7]